MINNEYITDAALIAKKGKDISIKEIKKEDHELQHKNGGRED